MLATQQTLSMCAHAHMYRLLTASCCMTISLTRTARSQPPNESGHWRRCSATMEHQTRLCFRFACRIEHNCSSGTHARAHALRRRFPDSFLSPVAHFASVRMKCETNGHFHSTFICLSHSLSPDRTHDRARALTTTQLAPFCTRSYCH